MAHTSSSIRKNAEADRAFLKDVLKFSFVDAHGGWLIFKLPPAEVAVHPSDENDMHELWLMTDDFELEIRTLGKAGVECESATQQRWVLRRASNCRAAEHSDFINRGMRGRDRPRRR